MDQHRSCFAIGEVPEDKPQGRPSAEVGTKKKKVRKPVPQKFLTPASSDRTIEQKARFQKMVPSCQRKYNIIPRAADGMEQELILNSRHICL
jgi:hypothetical protein